MPPTKAIQFRAGPLQDYLDERATGDQNANTIAWRDLDRYYVALYHALVSVDLSAGEAMLIIDSHNGTHIDINAAQMLHYQVEDALSDSPLAAKWEIDGPALVAKLRGYNLLQRLAIVDAVERWWGDTYHVNDGEARLVRVGLVKQD